MTDRSLSDDPGPMPTECPSCGQTTCRGAVTRSCDTYERDHLDAWQLEHLTGQVLHALAGRTELDDTPAVIVSVVTRLALLEASKIAAAARGLGPVYLLDADERATVAGMAGGSRWSLRVAIDEGLKLSADAGVWTLPLGRPQS